MAKLDSVLVRNDQEENQQIKRDLIFVATLNTIFLATLIGLYFYNQGTGRIDAFFADLLKF